MAYDVARSSFNPQALVAWTDTLWNRWSDLVNMQEFFDAEYVAVLELLLAMKNQTHSPDWSKWASNYSMVKTEAKDFKVRQFLDNAALAEKIKVLSRQHSKNKHKQAQAHPSHGSEKKTSRAATTVVVGAVPTSRLRVLAEPSSFHTCPATGFAP
jgi:hypothetical protein